MNLPDFCAEGWRTHALLLTYTLDPLFFETVALRRLEMGGAHRILVLADAAESLRRIGEAALDLRHAGRRWALGPVRTAGSFHAKLVARFGREDASVALLSGNLTPSGWGRNLEIGSSWLVGPSHEDRGMWLAALLAEASTWTVGNTQQSIIAEIRALPWMRSVEDTTAVKRPVLAAGDRPLLSEIRRRWAGRRFDRALIATGSTDADGAFVRELVGMFGLRDVEVFVDADRHSFLEANTRDLPLRLWSPPVSSHTLHAKVVWLTGSNGDAVAWGSANCSRSAWMLPPSRGGNVELVVLDDDPDSGALTALFTALRGGKALQPHPIAPSELATTAEVDIVSLLEAEVRSGGRWVVRAILSSDTILVAPILRVAAAGRTVVDVSLTLAPDGILVGSAPVPGGHLPLFAQLYCTIDGVEIKTQAIPVNQPDHLLRAQLDPDTARQLAAITPDKTSFAERDAVLQDLLEIAWQEFEDETQPIIEPPKPRREKREVRTDDEASALDPLDLVYRATTGASSLLSSHQGSAMPDVLSVFERLVWGTPERTAEAFDDRIGIEDDQNDDTHSGGRPLATSMRISDAGESQKAADSETAASVRLKLDDWICRLDGDDILSHANPPAAAFRCAHVILGISQAARRARWISARDAADFAIRTAACFLSRGRISALITRINARCETGLLRESFRTYIQSGRLLAAFITALTADEPTSIGEAIQRGSILARLRATPVLVAEIDENDLEALSAGSTDAADRIRRFSRVSEIATASDDLDRMLSQRRAGLMRKVGSGGTQRRPDVFWSSAEGWILDQATTTVVTSSVGWITAAGDPDVRRKAELVMHAWLGLQARPHYAAQAVAG